MRPAMLGPLLCIQRNPKEFVEGVQWSYPSISAMRSKSGANHRVIDIIIIKCADWDMADGPGGLRVWRWRLPGPSVMHCPAEPTLHEAC